MVCGGSSSNRIEFFDPSQNGFASNVFPGSLPCECLNGVLWDNRIVSFGREQVQETSLERPWISTVLIEDDELNNRGYCSLERIGNDIFIIGYSGERIERFDMVYKKLTNLSSLPYKVYDMVTVVFKDNIIIIGGRNEQDGPYFRSWLPSNDVLMYNIHSLECKRLPFMLQGRSGHAAVIMGDVIVVMGGLTTDPNSLQLHSVDTDIDTVEYYVIGDNEWKKLPAMNESRIHATACVYV